MEHTSKRWKRVMLALTAFALAGCSLTLGSDGTTTSTATTVVPAAVPSTTAATTVPSTSSTTGDLPKGDFETASCGELTGNLICEAYELIQRHYVDPVTADDLVD